MQKKDNHTWTPAGWTPTTTSPRFQLVSQVACLDANSGCSRWGDRSSAFRRRLPSFAPVVVVVDLAAFPQRASRSSLQFRFSPCDSTFALYPPWRSLMPSRFLPGSLCSLPPLSCDARSSATLPPSPPRPSLRSFERRAFCFACARPVSRVSFHFASRSPRGC